jgi:ketosteroid isomerase-like protein
VLRFRDTTTQPRETSMTDLDDFLVHTVERHALATTGVRSGDATSLIGMLSTRAPVTLFPASQPTKSGWTEVSEAFRRVASVYSDATPVGFEVLAAGVSGDLAYLVGYERGEASVAGAPAEQLSPRVTQVYRREDVDWKLVHRHADPGPGDDLAVNHLRAAMRKRSAMDCDIQSDPTARWSWWRVGT